MKSTRIFLVYFTFLTIINYIPTTWAANASDFHFDFSGYKNLAKLFITDCDVHNLQEELNRILGGVKTTGVIHEPHNSENISHVTCVDDPYMGKAINLTLYKMDDLPQHAHMQKLELKAVHSSKLLSAHRDDDIVYAWWFQLDPYLTVEAGPLIIFALKSEGHHTHHSLASLVLNKKHGLFLRLAADAKTNKTEKLPLLPLSDVRGKWIQAFVEVFYTNIAGFIRVVLKDVNGQQLFPSANQTGVFVADTFHPEWKSVRPRWSLNRKVSTDYPNIEYQLLQNLQIWKKF